MKEKSSFTTEKPIDYTQSKDAYEGRRESSVYRDSTASPHRNSNKNEYDDDNIPEIDLPKATS